MIFCKGNADLGLNARKNRSVKAVKCLTPVKNKNDEAHRNNTDSDPVWFRIYLIPNLPDSEYISKSLIPKTYLIPNISDSEHIWFRISDSEPI
jgi:hypothetical protein